MKYIKTYFLNFSLHVQQDIYQNNGHDIRNIESDDKYKETEETEDLSQGMDNQFKLQKFPIPITSVKPPELRFKRSIYHSTKLPRWQNPLYVSFCNNFGFQIQKK